VSPAEATGVAFVECETTRTIPAQAQARRRETVVSGGRVKTVDVHAHCAVPEAMALQYPDLAARQLEAGVRKYGLRGAAIIHPQGTGAPAEVGAGQIVRVAILGGTAAGLLGITG
jgi:hypothetical protein